MRLLIFQHVEGEGLGLFEYLLNRWGILFDTVAFYRSDSIPSLSDYDALIALGGPMNVYEEKEYPFLVAEDRAIKQVIADGKSFLGICLGAQLLAKALGAPVTASPIKEIGFNKVELTAEAVANGLLKGLPLGLPVFQWHGDTFAIPHGAIKLARSEHCSNQAFAYKGCAYGLQFHVEVTPTMIRDWEAAGEAEIREPGRPVVGELSPADLMERCVQLEAVAKVVLSNFVRGGS